MKALKAFCVLAASGAMMALAGQAVAQKSTGVALAAGCGGFESGSLFHAACMANLAVAQKDWNVNGMVTDAAYTNSCDGGGACVDSVYNKLTSAASKFAIPKVVDGCLNLASIQSDLLAWQSAGKPKINGTGYSVMNQAVQAIQSGNCP